jgi:hypothetical protein
MANGSVAALAFLKVNWEREGKDYLDNFIPLVAESIRVANLTVVTAEAVQEALRHRFGLELPLHPLNVVLSRARKAGLLRQEHRVLYPVPEALAATAFRDRESEARAVHERVVQSLRGFAKEEYGEEWDELFAERALLDALEADGTRLLFASYEGQAITFASASEVGRYVVGAFVGRAQERYPDLLNDLETLAKGYLLASALFLPRPGEHDRSFRRTTVFLDTRFLIYAAGYAGESLEAPARELCDLLYEYGADVRYFEDTLQEVLGVLNATLSLMKQGRSRDAYGDVMAYLIASGKDAGDLELMIARLPEKLRYLRIDVADTPDYKEKQFVVDEPGFEAALQANIRYKNHGALIHDVDAISAVARIRRGRDSFVVETCRALFVTTNTDLAKVTRRFFQPEATYGSVPLCLTDQALASVLWTKGPSKAPDLPRKLLISNAFAATQPTDDFWKLYLAEIARLEEKDEISDTDYALLRYSTAAKRAAMDITRGDRAAFTEGTVQEILRRAEAAIREELETELQEKNLELGERTAILDGTRAELEALELRYKEEIQRRDHRDELVGQIRAERIMIAARTLARHLIRIPQWIIMTALVVGILLTFPFNLPGLSAAWMDYIAPVILALLLIAQLVDLGFDLSPKQLFSTGERHLAAWLAQKGQWLLTSVETDTSDHLTARPVDPDLSASDPIEAPKLESENGSG